MTGVVVKGPLQNVFVVLDLDGDGQGAAAEPTTRIDSISPFSLFSSISYALSTAVSDSFQSSKCHADSGGGTARAKIALNEIFEFEMV